MNDEREYEDWTAARREGPVPAGFTERVMGSLAPGRPDRWRRLARTAALVLAGAALAFRAICTLALLALSG